MVDELSRRLVPDELWVIVEPLLPVFPARSQGGGTAPTDQRAVFTTVVFVLTQRLRVAVVAAVVRSQRADRASPVHPHGPGPGYGGGCIEPFSTNSVGQA